MSTANTTTDHTCLHCASLGLKDKKIAVHGFGHCDHELIGSYVSINKPACSKFSAASATITEKRIEWAERLK